MTVLDGPRPGNWGGIRTGRFEIHALGRVREVLIDVADFTARMDMGAAALTDVPDHLLPQTLDKVRAAYPVTAEHDQDVTQMLRDMNAQRTEDGDYSCAFDSDSDPAGIPDGYGCGGCSCHLSAPCHHCLAHQPSEDAEHVTTMLALTGRTTR